MADPNCDLSRHVERLLTAAAPKEPVGFDEEILAIARHDAMTFPGFLCADFRAEILKEAERLPFVRQPREVPPYGVRQDYSACWSIPQGTFTRGFAEEIGDAIEVCLRASASHPLSEPLRFNDLSLQRYEAGSNGISPHRDGKNCRGLIGIMILEGSGRFCLCDNRKGDNPLELRNEPGDLILMRAPGFLGSDRRPFHFVDRVTTRRTTLGLRHKVI